MPTRGRATGLLCLRKKSDRLPFAHIGLLIFDNVGSASHLFCLEETFRKLPSSQATFHEITRRPLLSSAAGLWHSGLGNSNMLRE